MSLLRAGGISLLSPKCLYKIDMMLWVSKKKRIIITMVMVKHQERATL